MKLTRKILAMMLSVMMIATTFLAIPVSADFTDITTEHTAFEAVNVLSKLGVINGYDDGSFKPDNNVTRAEFTAMLLRTRGMGALGSTSLENPPFPDVVTPDVSWAIGNIRTAREMGIINGYDDGTFLPNNNVLYEEAVKMIVCALGYGEMGAEGAKWYSRYLMTATSLKFTNGAGGAIGVPATRATIANMLYNCLEVNLAENNEITSKTILVDDLGLTKKVGFIASNPEISLSTPESNLRDNEIQITAPDAKGQQETLTYKVDDVSKYEDMLGAEITFYYTIDRNSNFNNLLMATVRNSESIEIPAANIVSIPDSNSIEYVKDLDDERSITASISANSVVVYNGKLYGANQTASTFGAYSADRTANSKAILPTIGSVKLLDRDGDHNYDVVFIEDYEAWYVSAKTSSNYSIVDNVLHSNGSIVLDPKNVTFKTLKGSDATFSSINANSIICVKKSNMGNLTSVIICDNAVTGKVTATSSKNGYTIGEKIYKVSAQAKWKDNKAPAFGDNGKFYLDCDGNIIYFDKNQEVSNQQYGYITGVNSSSADFENTLQLYILTKSNVKGSKYTVSDKAELIAGSNTYEGNDIALQLGTGGMLVKFTTNSKGLVDEIIMAESVTTGKDIVADKLYKYDDSAMVDTNGDYSYNSTNKQLTSGSAKMYIGSASLILKVPASGNSSEFKTMKVSDFVNNKDGYVVEYYDVTATNSAKVVLVHAIPADTGIGEVKANSPVIFVKSVTQDIGSDGESRYTLNGFVGSNAVAYQLSIVDSKTVAAAPGIKAGDMIRLGKDDYDYYTVDIAAGHKIFTVSEAVPNGTYPKTENNDGGSVAFQTVWGWSNTKDDDRFIVKVPGDSLFEMNNSWFSGAKIFEINTAKSPVDDEYIVDRTAKGDTYEGVLEELYSARPNTEIFIHMTNASSVKTMIIVNRPSV